MTTAYTAAELGQLERNFAHNMPRQSTQADLKVAPRVTAFTMAGSDCGIVFKLKISGGCLITTHLNVVVTAELFTGIGAAAERGGWWKTDPKYRRDPAMGMPTGRDPDIVVQVISLTTSAAGPEMLVNLAGTGPGESIVIGLPRKIAEEIFLGIQIVAERAGWWDEEFKLMPMC